jgi:hypothetical protein
MKQLFYVSNTSLIFKGKEDIEDILETASNYNNQKGLSGVLLYHSGLFLQLLEGEAADVDLLYSKIFKDPRHNNVTVLFELEAQKRIFTKWGMAYRDVNELDIKMVNQMLSWARLIQGSKELDNNLILEMLEQFKERISQDELPNLVE